MLPVMFCSLWGPRGALYLEVYWPAQFCCVWPQINPEPTTYGSSIARTNAVCTQAPPQDAPVPALEYYRLVLGAAVGIVYRRTAPLWLLASEFGADYEYPASTELNRHSSLTHEISRTITTKNG